MLNLKFIQENKETVIERLAVKNFDARESVEKIIALDNQRKSLQQGPPDAAATPRAWHTPSGARPNRKGGRPGRVPFG